MANYVNSYISITNVSEEGQKFWDDLVKRISEFPRDSWETHLGYFLKSDLSEVTRSEMCDFCGAKWAYASDFDETGMRINSAWSPVREFVEWIAEGLAEVDPEAIIQYTYEDEMPNFIGAEVYTNGELEDAVEDSWEDILERLLEENQELREVWDSEGEEWTDDGDLIHEYLWEYIDSWQHRFITDVVNFILENRS